MRLLAFEPRLGVLKFISAAIAATTALGLASTVDAKDTLVLGTIQSPTAPITKAAEFFAKEITARTQGRFAVNVVNSAQLGPAIEQIQNVQTGAQDLFLDDIGWNGQFVKDYGVLAVPFAISGPDGFRSVLRSELGQGWRAQMEKEFGLHTLSDIFIRSPRVVFSTKEMHSPQDMKGIKFRVPEIDVYFNSWKAIGVNPTPVPWGELYLALRQGVVDGGEGPFTTVLPTKFPEVTKYVLETNHLYSSNTLLMNADRFAKLSDEDKGLFQDATDAAVEFFNAEIATLEREHRDEMTKNYGVVFSSPTPEQRADFARRVAEAVPQFEADGLWSKGLYQKVLAAQ